MGNETNKGHTMKSYKVGDTLKMKNLAGHYFVRVSKKHTDVKNGQPGFSGYTVQPQANGRIFVSAIDPDSGSKCWCWGYDFQVLEVNPRHSQAKVDYPELAEHRTAGERNAARKAAREARK